MHGGEARDRQQPAVPFAGHTSASMGRGALGHCDVASLLDSLALLEAPIRWPSVPGVENVVVTAVTVAGADLALRVKPMNDTLNAVAPRVVSFSLENVTRPDPAMR